MDDTKQEWVQDRISDDKSRAGYTGFKDRYGAEIYDGDTIAINFSDDAKEDDTLLEVYTVAGKAWCKADRHLHELSLVAEYSERVEE